MEILPATSKFPGTSHVGTVQDHSPFAELVASLAAALGPSSGRTLDDVDVAPLMRFMKLYTSQECEWAKYAFGNNAVDYTRNLIDEGNGKSNLLVLVWSPGRGSPIHDHGNAHCLMKILKGNLTETRYAFPQQGQVQSLKTISKRTHSENEVAYMADDLGLHRMSNEGSDVAVSLHLYTPPHVARKGCHVFDEKTGKRKHVAGHSYHSAYGKILERGE